MIKLCIGIFGGQWGYFSCTERITLSPQAIKFIVANSPLLIFFPVAVPLDTRPLCNNVLYTI